MEHTLETYDDIAVRKELSYLCILVVLILHILFLLLLFTFTHLMVKSEPMPPSFDTVFDVGPAAGGSAMPSGTGTGTSADDEEGSASEDASIATDDAEEIEQTAVISEDSVPDDSVSGSETPSDAPMALPEGTPVPDIVDPSFLKKMTGKSESITQGVIQQPSSMPRKKTSGRVTYRVRKTRYDTHYAINGTTFAQMGQQVQSSIAQSVTTQAKEKQNKNLKYQSYVNGLHKFLYGNFNPRNEAINLEYSVYMPIDVDIEIDKSGTCKNISMSNSTGDRDLDSFIIYHLKKAGPFPPLPNHFGVESWHFQLRLMVNCQRGKGIPKITPH